ncbi:hypothetical protein [Adhaeribacter pallidiroseus]|uniref:DUF4476 domain-containing protein n=1 Tax=Adhaeribacter pallidiroseus TaxID=2072847 RepID=A0A369QFK8_9BACT|nr:hypothetical protein [Adhaeribacter pallidiroseus]RDC63212.1 hypothetical protein AHMF7616_01813 [Adhaeribacter pallidiroseus]
MMKELSKSIKFVYLFLGLSLITVAANAQRVDIQEWPKGRLILTSGDTLLGPLTYHRTEDIVRITSPDGSIQAFAPVNVASFTVSDGRFSQTFKPYMWNRGNDYSDYKAPSFFEQLNDGRFSLVKRETIVRRNMNSGPMYAGYGRYYDPYGYGNATRFVEQVQELFYLHTPDNTIVALRKPKRDLEEIFGKQNKEMKAFISANKLDYDNARDLVLIVSHYNSISQ